MKIELDTLTDAVETAGNESVRGGTLGECEKQRGS